MCARHRADSFSRRKRANPSPIEAEVGAREGNMSLSRQRRESVAV
jgi:hypothetical protein